MRHYFLERVPPRRALDIGGQVEADVTKVDRWANADLLIPVQIRLEQQGRWAPACEQLVPQLTREFLVCLVDKSVKMRMGDRVGGRESP